MEQGGRDGDANQNKNQQHKQFKVVEDQATHQPPPPRTCPRCESLNTKFCYYNNYNLSQPRYFCKNCRRYWTHGGTLRNVPVGGSSRKAKRGRVSPISCGGESSRSRPFPPPRQPQPPPQQQPEGIFPDIANMAALVSGIVNLPPSTQQSSRTISWVHPLIPGSIYPNGLFAGFDGMQMPPLSGQAQGMNRPLHIGGGINASTGAGANTPIFQGFDFSSMKPQQAPSQPLQIRDQPRQFIGIGNQNKDKQPMFTPDGNMVLPAGNLNSWTTTGSSSNTGTSNSNIWSNTNGASTSGGPTEPSFNPNDWPNIPDYDDAE